MLINIGRDFGKSGAEGSTAAAPAGTLAVTNELSLAYFPCHLELCWLCADAKRPTVSGETLPSNGIVLTQVKGRVRIASTPFLLRAINRANYR